MPFLDDLHKKVPPVAFELMRVPGLGPKKAKALTDADKALLATKAQWTGRPVSLDEWHTLVVRTAGDELSVAIDGAPAARFTSPGIGHATKSLVSLTTNAVDVEYDDFSIKAAVTP